MTLTEVLAIASGLAIGYWFVGVFVPHATKDATEADRSAARERAEGPWLQDRADAASPAPLPDSPAPSIVPWHEVLGVSAHASREEVRAAYHARMEEHRPDRVAGMGEDIRALAVRKSREIHEAYLTAIGDH